ncbi:MAG: CRTAC1 family protein [Planctomycetota bacterium]
MVDITPSTGIAFEHTHGGGGRQYTVEFMVAGLALWDYNQDGLVDIYFLNGAPLKGTTVDEIPRNALYRNNGDGTFTDVTAAAGVGDKGYGLGVAVGDYDNDGHQDFYINNFGPNTLYRGNGDGTFTDVTSDAGVGCGSRFGAGTCFLDMEGDGDLDLYAANYLDFTYERHAVVAAEAYPYPPGPQDYPPVADTLYRNDGNGTFTDVSDSSGIANVAGTSMGMICFDYEQDGDTDIFVGNDAMPNYLFQNDGTGRFTEVGLLAGLACNNQGVANGSMGIDSGDYNNDGLLDLFMTDYTGEFPVLYRNLGNGLFDDATNSTGAGRTAFTHTNWGTGLVDFDNDSHQDIFMACGHFLENVREIDNRAAYRAPNLLLHNQGNGRFLDVSDQAGPGMAVVECSKGAAFGDLDNDGDIDVVVLNTETVPTVLRNDTHTDHHWLQIELRGKTSNRDGVGAQVTVIAGGVTQTAERHGGRGYQSHFGNRLHFGLGNQEHVDRVEVRWIGGKTDVFESIPANQVLWLKEHGTAVRKH